MKREPEQLDALVAAALRRIGPISAYALAASLRERGYKMTETQAYRVLKRLIARGKARQVQLGRRYAGRRLADPPSLVLACSRCGRVGFALATALDTALRTAAVSHSFRVEEVILETSGRCSGCQRTEVEVAS